MILEIENIGKVSKARIELNGITIIAGENDTGKSTISKALFSIIDCFYHPEERINNERHRSILRLLELFEYESKVHINRINVKDFVNKREFFLAHPESLGKAIDDLISMDINSNSEVLSENDISSISEKVYQRLKISDYEVLANVLGRRLLNEFASQVCNMYHMEKNGIISLETKGQTITVSIKNNEEIMFSNMLSLATEAIYIDDPYILDRIASPTFTQHGNHLRLKLQNMLKEVNENNAIDDIISSKKLGAIYNKLSSICSGRLINQKATYLYSDQKSGFEIKIPNLSSGLKTFVVLKTLLVNSGLQENGTIILDEPEIHLHPEWQLVFAELIVLIQKEFSMHILLNTHSPYFLNAIEVYAAKYEITNLCKYYLAENVENKSTITDVTNCIERIYNKLARPLQKLENERYSNNEY